MSGLRAGTSAVALETPLGLEMMGYGARTGKAEARHDPLHARALYLEQPGGGQALLIECELCLVAPAQADQVRARIRERTGLPPECVLVGCIHTHSGPDTGLGALLAGAELPAHVEPLLEGAVEAGVRAWEAAAPAALGVGHAQARIGRNRRVDDGPLDPDVLVVRVDPAESDGPLALLYVHGCHPTALGHDNLAYSADWPWAAGEAIRRAFPGTNPIFALGAHADVDPRTRGLLDLAIPDQSVGVGFDEVEALGREVGEAVAKTAAGIATSRDAAVGAASTRVRVPVHPGAPDEAEGRRRLDERRAEALAALDLPPDVDHGPLQLLGLEQERTAHLPHAERRAAIARVRHYLRDRTAARFAGARVPEVEVQVLRLGEACLLGLPLEPTVDVGLDWKRRVGSPSAAVIGIANGWLRYLPHPRNFAERGADQKYEILMSTLVPAAAERLLAEAEALERGLRLGAAA